MNLTDKINIMVAKQNNAEILAKQQDGTWVTVEDPEFNWSTTDYRVKPDYQLLFDKFKAALNIQELYEAVHAEERGKDLPPLNNALASKLREAKNNVSRRLANAISESNIQLNDDEIEKLDCYKNYKETLYNHYMEIINRTPGVDLIEDYFNLHYKAEYEAKLQKYKQELNNLINNTRKGAIIPSVVVEAKAAIDEQINLATVGTNLEPTTTTKEALQEKVLALFAKAVTKFLENEKLKAVVCKENGLGITITRTDNANPTIQIYYLSYNKVEGNNEVPAVDWTLDNKKIVTISNITTQQLQDLQDNITRLEKKHDDTLGAVKQSLENNQVDNLQNIEINKLKEEITKLNSKIAELENNQFKKGSINTTQLDSTIASGYYSVAVTGGSYSGALLVFNMGGSAGVIQFYKNGYSKEVPWKVRNAIDCDINRWTPWSILVDDSMFKLEGTTLDIDIPNP